MNRNNVFMGIPDAYIFAHDPGEEFYVIAENFPFDVATETAGEGSDCVVEQKVCFCHAAHTPV